MSQQSTPGSIVCQCRTCGKVFQTFACYVRKGGGRYCSFACYAASKRRRVERTCAQCGLVFKKTPGQIARGWGLFCSIACQRLASRRRVSAVCQTCGRSYEVVSSREGKTRFCSRRCTRPGPRPSDPVACFWSHVEKADGCWLWTGCVDSNGAARFSAILDGVQYGHAVRFSYHLHFGLIPDGLLVCHKCDINYPRGDVTYRRCVRPDHLFLGTHADNSDDMSRKNRSHRPKLTVEMVRQMRADYESGRVTQKHLAEQYGVSAQTVLKVLHRKLFKYV